MANYDPIEETRRKLRKLNRWGLSEGKLVAIAFVAGVVLLGGFSSYYQVRQDEVAVVLRFGERIEPNRPPGLHFKLPFGIDRVYKVPVARQLKMEFGFRTVRAGIESEFARDRRATEEAKMLTADPNVAVVEWIVQYKIEDPEKYLFNFRDIDTTLRLMSEASMRLVVGDYTVDELITSGREEIEIQARDQLTALNKKYDTGITIQQLKLQDANVPEPVKPALRDVEEAKQERARAINQAQTERNKIIPQARGRAERTVAAARGYHAARVNEAQGEAGRFLAVYEEFRKAPDVTRTRLYLETMTEVLSKSKRKVLVDDNIRSLVPLLNLDSGGK